MGAMSGGGGNNNYGSSYAFVDPYFQIDPAFQNAGNFSFVFSAGVGNDPVGALPEPENYAMMAVGLGLVGFVARRRG